MIKAGELDRRITIRRPGAPIDDGMQTLPGPLEDYTTCSAKWTPARGRETFENLGREAYAGGTFLIRRNPTTLAIKETDKVSYHGRSWDIIGVTERDRDGLELLVVAGELNDLPVAES